MMPIGQEQLKRYQNDIAMVNMFTDGVSDLVFWSFRYFLGRQTIHATIFARELAAAWSYLDPKVQALIRKELERAFDETPRPCPYLPLGDDCDRAAWQLVRDAYSKPTPTPTPTT